MDSNECSCDVYDQEEDKKRDVVTAEFAFCDAAHLRTS